MSIVEELKYSGLKDGSDPLVRMIPFIRCFPDQPLSADVKRERRASQASLCSVGPLTKVGYFQETQF